MLLTAVQEVTTIGPVHSILLTAAATAVAGGLAALLGIWIGSRNEYKKWLRERKHETYIQFLVETQPLSAEAFLPTVITGQEDNRWELDRIRSTAYAKLMVVASSEVADAAIDLYNDLKSSRSLVEELFKKSPEIQKRFEQAIRKAVESQSGLTPEVRKQILGKLLEPLSQSVLESNQKTISDGFALIHKKHQRLTQLMRADLKMPQLSVFGSAEEIWSEILHTAENPRDSESS